MIIYGQQIDIQSINPYTEIAKVRVSMAEAKTISIDEENISGVFGGYGGSQTRQMPLKKVLTPQELADWRFIKWLYHGQYKSRMFAKDSADFIQKVKNTPRLSRVKRVTARGNLVLGVTAKAT